MSRLTLIGIGLALLLAVGGFAFYSQIGSPVNELTFSLQQLTDGIVAKTDPKQLFSGFSDKFAVGDGGWSSFYRNAVAAVISIDLKAITLSSVLAEVEENRGQVECVAIIEPVGATEERRMALKVFFERSSSNTPWKIVDIHAGRTGGVLEPVGQLLPQHNASEGGFSDDWWTRVRPTLEQRVHAQLTTIANLLLLTNVAPLIRYFPNSSVEYGLYEQYPKPEQPFYSAVRNYLVQEDIKEIKVTVKAVTTEQTSVLVDVEFESSTSDPNAEPTILEGRVLLARSPGTNDKERRAPQWMFSRLDLPDGSGGWINAATVLHNYYGAPK